MTLTQTATQFVVHSCMEFFSRWFPERTAEFTLKQMLSPPPFRFKDRDMKALEAAQLVKINYENIEVATWNWHKLGNTRRVILVHGWAGASVQFRHYIEPLLKEGFNITLIDLPAHGRSSGKQTNLPESSRIVREVMNHFSDTYAVIGHSFGAAAVSVAINWGGKATKAILLAPMSDVPHSLGKIVRGYGASRHVLNLIRARSEENFNLSWDDISPVSFSHQLNVPALIIHDKDDSDIELDQSYRLHSMWPQSKIWVSEGLGHYRILKNKELINKSIEFLKNESANELATD